jgi:hypothetical protein
MATKYTWPTDPPGKPASHGISWAQHQQDLAHQSVAQAQSQSSTQVAQAQSAGQVQAAQAPAAAAAAAQGSTPDVAPQPYDPNLELQKLSAGFNQGLANSEATYQQGQTAYQTGYNADGTVNSANPYNQAALLQRNYQQAKLGTTNSLASAGQLYSGAMANAQGANDFNYSSASNALQNQAQNAYHTIGFNQLSSIGQNIAGLSSDQLSSLLKSVYGS